MIKECNQLIRQKHAYGTSENLVSQKEVIKCNNVIKRYKKMINALVNLINYEPDIDKTYLYAKDLCKAKYRFLIKKSEDIQTKHLNGSKALIEYSNNM